MLSGCQAFKTSPPLTPTPAVFQQAPTQSDLFSVVNQRTQATRQIQAEVSVGLSGVPAKLNGSLIVEQPQNLRMKIAPLGMNSLGADIGSNDREFWAWIKSGGIGTESVIMHAKHEEYLQSQAASVLPIDPSLIFDALGLIRFDQQAKYSGPTVRTDGRLEVKTYQNTAGGMKTSVLVFDPKSGVLLQKSLYDQRGDLLGFCDMSDHQYFPEIQTALPTQIKLTIRPQSKFESIATIRLSNVRVNGLYVDAATAWQMPQPSDVKFVDLARTSIMPEFTSISVGAADESGSATKSSFLPFRGALLHRF